MKGKDTKNFIKVFLTTHQKTAMVVACVRFGISSESAEFANIKVKWIFKVVINKRWI